MLLYWPEAKGERIDSCGYNHAVMLLRKALAGYITDDPAGADFRVYANLPWHHDPAWLKKEGLPILAYTMYESTRVPTGWIRFLNKHVAVVVVPTMWCKNVFVASGLIKPIYVVALGVDADNTPNLAKQHAACAPYRFLWQGVAYDPTGRKGVDVAVKAFKELKDEGKLLPDDELVLKFRPYEETKFVMDDVRSGYGVRFLQRDMPRKDLHALIQSADCCINPTHAEGFGLIPLEQMAMGKPVLVTEYSIPYAEKPCCIPLKYKTKRSPVIWNHKHVILSANGISYNFGGLQQQIMWMPRKLNRKPTKAFTEVTFRGMVEHKVRPAKAVLNAAWNVLAWLQTKLGLYNNPKRRSVTLYQEFPGLDAHVDVQDLKDKMMWCYNNRHEAEDMGFLAREYATKCWGLDNVRFDFERIISELQTISKEQKNG